MWGMLLDGEDGKPSVPVTSMVANLAKPTPERPALMSHDDVVTFFHEMGKSTPGRTIAARLTYAQATRSTGC